MCRRRFSNERLQWGQTPFSTRSTFFLSLVATPLVALGRPSIVGTLNCVFQALRFTTKPRDFSLCVASATTTIGTRPLSTLFRPPTGKFRVEAVSCVTCVTTDLRVGGRLLERINGHLVHLYNNPFAFKIGANSSACSHLRCLQNRPKSSQ